MPLPTKKKGYRSLLPADRCVFCKNKTDVYFECDECQKQMCATCSDCRAYGAPSIRAPRRMITVRTKKKNAKGKEAIARICYPQCARKSVYHCRNCGIWHDRTMLHAVSRENANSNDSICTICSAAGRTVCASCHGVTRKESRRKDKTGYRCNTCFERRANFTPSDRKEFKPVIKRKGVKRTFGMELEINNLHLADTLAKEIDALKINDIEFVVKRDGSIHRGFEVCTLPADVVTLKKAVSGLCSTIRSYKHDYQESGIHVHIKDPDISPLQVFKMWCAVEAFHWSSLPRFRQNSTYCRPIVKDMTRRMEDVINMDHLEQAIELTGRIDHRYTSLNLRPLAKYGTLEYRTHHGTTNYRELTHFLTFLDCMYNTAKKVTNEDLMAIHLKAVACLNDPADESSFKAVSEALKLPKYTRGFLWSRHQFYAAHRNVSSATLNLPTRFRYDNGAPPPPRGQEPPRDEEAPSPRRARPSSIIRPPAWHEMHVQYRAASRSASGSGGTGGGRPTSTGEDAPLPPPF